MIAGRKRSLQILGTRGIPGRHGGFETFAEQLSLYLVEHDWDVTVYCQLPEQQASYTDMWRGVRRVHLSNRDDPWGTVRFDLAASLEALKRPGLMLLLGYNTGLFNALFLVNDRNVLTNMDGIEWKRAKWSIPARVWLWMNEWLAAKLSTHLIADHPAIKVHLRRHSKERKITTIPYGAERIDTADERLLQQFGLTPNRYFIVIARPEPENSILEIVRAYSSKPRDMPLVVLGNYKRNSNGYHAQIMEIAGKDCIFIGAIYDKDILKSLRFFARGYLHGHQVGGTNPSLVEALAAGSPVIAHDNRFTRGVTAEAALYFKNEAELCCAVETLISDDELVQSMRIASYARHAEAFTQERVLGDYECLLARFV